MKRASQLLTDEEKKAVQDAVAEAERGTSGEVVPVVATRSGRYDRGEDLFGVVLGLAAVTVGWLVGQDAIPPGDWGERWEVVLGLVAVLVLFVGGFTAGAALATRFPELALLFVGKKEMLAEVQRAGAAAFYRFRVRRTAGGTGILIYVSLLERMVWVFGDAAIAERHDQSRWEELKDTVIAGIRQGRAAEGLCAAIARCGEILAEYFPIQPGDVNELTNELRVVD